MAFGLVVNGVVEACSNNATGILRLSTATKPCLTAASYGLLRETAISWNQIGQQGIQGIQGIKGDTGATGATGVQGEPGRDGAPGPTGPTGAQGIQGVQGLPGEQGEKGLQGIPGVKGDPGPVGSVSGIESLAGTSCKAGRGTLEVSYAADDQTVKLSCNPNVTYTLALRIASPITNFPCSFVPTDPGPPCEWSVRMVSAEFNGGSRQCRNDSPNVVTCNFTAAAGTSVLLSTLGAPVTWSGDCLGTSTLCTVVLDANKQVNATFP